MTLREEEADELREYIEESHVKVFAHGTYMDYPWAGKVYPPKFIAQELEMCSRAGISGLVVHLGKPPIDVVMQHLPKLKTEHRDTLIYLETPHVKPENSHYETPEKLAELFTAIRQIDPSLSHFGLCIDTAHLWSCGVDIATYEDAEAWTERLEAVSEIIPPGKLIIHLNDSHDTRGSGLDHHAPLLGGKIWSEFAGDPSQSGLAAFVHFALRNEIPLLLERKPKEALLNDYAALEKISGDFRPSGP